MNLLFLFMTSALINFSYAEEPSQNPIEGLKDVTSKYSATNYLKAKFNQIQILELLGEEKKSKGELFYSNKKLRIELQGENSSTTLFTPGVIVSLMYGPDKNPVQVIKSKPYPHPLINLIFGDAEVWNDFKIVKTHRNTSKETIVTVKPKRPVKLAGIEKIKINFNKKKLELKEISYWDDIGNETIYKFDKQSYLTKIDGTKFILVPPKGVEIKEL